jgi:hypothetical protein
VATASTCGGYGRVLSVANVPSYLALEVLPVCQVFGQSVDLVVGRVRALDFDERGMR